MTFGATSGIDVSAGNSLTITTPSGAGGTGQLHAAGPEKCAAIGGNRGSTAGNITILGGWIYASGGNYGAAGIGGGSKRTDEPGGSGGNITILGGRVWADGGESDLSTGAGIGGGWGGSGGNIKIGGGIVKARGGRCVGNEISYTGAGIGGGGWGSKCGDLSGGNITITGGTVEATGGDCRDSAYATSGAGIGGGGGCRGGNITILGGTVTATGGYGSNRGGAGIGGGGIGDGGTVTISGGTVYAQGGYKADGIGAGFGDHMNSGTLSSGTNGSAWIIASYVGADKSKFTSGVLSSGGSFYAHVYGNPVISTDAFLDALTLWIKKDQTLTIAPGTALTVVGGIVSNDGTLFNDGTLDVHGTLNSSGRISNDGTISGDLPQTLNNYGQIDNTGTIGGIGTLNNYGQISNWGKISVKLNDKGLFLPNGAGEVKKGRMTLTKDLTLTGKLTIARGAILMVEEGVALTVAEGGELVNNGILYNKGIIHLPVGTDIKKLNINPVRHIKWDRGIIEMGGKFYSRTGWEIKEAPLKQPTAAEKEAAKNIADEHIRRPAGTGSKNAAGGAPSVMSGLSAAEAEVKLGNILINTEDVDGDTCAMSVNVVARSYDYAVIAKGQMGDVTEGDTEAAKNGTIAFVVRFIDAEDPEKAEEIPFDEVPVSEVDTEELDLTTVIVNGKASEEVQAMSEYKRSGLVDGQGLAIFYDEETKVPVLVIFDGDENDGLASAYICAKEGTGGGAHGSSGCSAGVFAPLALAALAAMRYRKK